MLVKRLISGFSIFFAFCFMLFKTPVWGFCIFAFIINMICMREFLWICRIKSKSLRGVYYIAGIFLLVMTYLNSFNGHIDIAPLILILSCLFFFCLNIITYKSDKPHDVKLILFPFFGIFFVSFLISYFIRLRALPDGAMNIFFLVFIVKMGDVGAYSIGKSMGKTKLAVNVSPKKTVEGALGGLLFTVITSVIMGFNMRFSIIESVVFAILLSVIGQLGDLSESLLKRVCTVKDASDTVPGIGGFLDIMDSLLFTAPVFYYLLIFKG